MMQDSSRSASPRLTSENYVIMDFNELTRFRHALNDELEYLFLCVTLHRVGQSLTDT